MGKVELALPKMGESVAEATIIKWLKDEGDSIEAEEPVLEIATDKVDSEVPAPVNGILVKKLFEEGAVVKVGEVLAVFDAESEANKIIEKTPSTQPKEEKETSNTKESISPNPEPAKTAPEVRFKLERKATPLARSIMTQEGIEQSLVQSVTGSGPNNKITKVDVLALINDNKATTIKPQPASGNSGLFLDGKDEIIEMDRMRRLISDHMVMSKQVSPHVTSMVEADVTNIVNWRNKVKTEFLERENEKITFTPVFVEAVAKAIKDFPMINISVDGTNIVVRNDINIGMATALPTGNLIVPVIKKADQKNLLGITKTVNDLANRARNNELKPDEIQGGTFTITNVGSFGNVTGAPIINQPQVAILAVGEIKKQAAVIEGPEGDTIGIRSMMFLSLSYDHRVVDGALGGSFLRRIADYLERFDPDREI